ncbi:MAG: ABC transporter permease [Ardenticatenaceae bacterium]|nr:ABC transporter permease [Anaerolineales bacterium]MCB8938379.1 ABC transporter permease [Ardenticatenaceae bacterium]MCB8975311.1 ABC transporter permease [Ardenticatenaceae bacterium]
MQTILIFAELTIRESQRRKVLWLALLLAISFLTIFGLGLHLIYRELARVGVSPERVELGLGLLFSSGLYVINFLVVVMGVLISVTAVSGEIDSHTIEALVTKPVRRWEVILGKWLGFAAMLTIYILLLVGGLILIYRFRTGFAVPNIPVGLGLMLLQGLLVLSLTILGGTRLSTLANGVLAFMMVGIAFIGGWVEQIGSLLQNETAVDIGIVTSLIMPTEILWKQALALLQPRVTSSPFAAGPFVVLSQPSDLMIWYAVVYTAVLLLLSLLSFSRRDL